MGGEGAAVPAQGAGLVRVAGGASGVGRADGNGVAGEVAGRKTKAIS